MRYAAPVVALCAALALMRAPAAAEPADPNLWLEEIEGDQALAWVRAQNARYLPELESTPGFAAWRARAEGILEDPRRIAWPSGVAPTAVTRTQVFNFWRDEKHVRGIWRVSPRAAFDAGQPEWQIVLDIDALAAKEHQNWQFAGATCLPPEFSRCLVSLSIGGKDAHEIREFDLVARRFIPASEGGFHISEAKQTLNWIDADTLLVASDFGPGTQTTSGYPRQARLWRRGTSPGDAPLLLDAAATDMGVFPGTYGAGASRRAIIHQALTFWTARLHHVGADGVLYASPLPADADFRLIADVGQGPTAFALLRTSWAGFPAGALVGYPVPPAGGISAESVRLVYAPAENEAIQSVEATGKAVYVSLLADVAAALRRLTPQGETWAQADVALPAHVSLEFVAADDADSLYTHIAGFTRPARLMRLQDGGSPQVIAEAPALFDGAQYSVSQHFTPSGDGTRIPFFVVRPKGAQGPLPTLLWGYGGFEIALTPGYVTPEVMSWLEDGGQYIVANLRGGGEYGPRWHQAALLENRQRSYDDLHAIALAAKGQGLAGKIAVHGRSNGGLMAGVAYTQRPDLYDAALVGVPLADMRRYHRLLAGASWMAEYGNPDEPAHWDFISKYSPYHNIMPEKSYPRVFFYTSTKDDRVHPGHARKMAARMQAQGHPVYYYENIDGGHAGVANLKEAAYRYALIRAYLEREIGGNE